MDWWFKSKGCKKYGDRLIETFVVIDDSPHYDAAALRKLYKIAPRKGKRRENKQND